jgi:molybdate transport system regulatory protein
VNVLRLLPFIFIVVRQFFFIKVSQLKLSNIQYEDVLSSNTTDKRVEVLRSLDQAGSISEAARVNGISYKAAWQAIETLSNLAGVALVEKAVGGSGGGGARLSSAGIQVLKAADLLHAARKQAIASIRQGTNDQPLNLAGIAAVNLRTSMRNQLPCTVKAIELTPGSARVTLSLADCQDINARITLESLELLDLTVGMQALALFKATAVRIAPQIVAIGQINLLRGKVSRRSGTALAEVAIQLSRGLALVGFAEAGTTLRLRQAAMAAIDERAVVIGIAG